MYKRFLLNSKDVSRSAVIWNPIGGMINSCQSALLLIVISRTNPIEDSGMYSLAYAIASMALTLGLFGIRHFQSSDVNEEYSFKVYRSSRVISDIFMIALILFYVIKGYFFQDYSLTKILIIMIVGMLKLVDSVDDVYCGRLQQKGRLDIAAKSVTVRYIGFILVTMVMLVLTKNLVISFVVGFVFSCVCFLFNRALYHSFLETDKIFFKYDKKIIDLLKNTFIVMLGGFLMIYIANAPKYAIDKLLSEADQACFNYIFMPVYIVSTLSLFIFQPVITQMAERLNENDMGSFKKIFTKQMLLITGICALVLAGGFLLGIPVLSIFFNTDLNPLKMPFMILLAGGCLLAYASFISVCVIVLRGQNLLLIGYAIPAVAEFFLANFTVANYGIPGVACLYTVLIFIQLIVFAVILYSLIIKMQKGV